MKKIFSFLIALTALTSLSVFDLAAQATDSLLTVSGSVTDSSGTMMTGVVVMVEELSIGTVTVNGIYSLNVPSDAMLSVSFLGYATQKIPVENRQVIDIVMEEEKEVILEPAKPINLTPGERAIAKTDNDMAFKMFREVSKQEGDNTFFSPLSLGMALAMLRNGASGRTYAEIIEALGLSEFSDSEINEYCRKISLSMLETDPSLDIAIANSIWYRKDLPVKSSFIETGKQYFDAEIRELDFGNPGASNMINEWGADKTNDRINNMVGEISDDMMMFVVNALYFKSKWEKGYEFDEEQTKLDDFTKADDQKTKVHLMEQTSHLPYYADEYMQCVELDYGNGAFSMVAVLPSENMDIDRFIESLDNTKWQSAIDGMKSQRVWLKLPRFEIECDFSLNQPIRDLGMERIFSGGFANISDDPIWVSGIRQKTFVKVNEEGSEAAAVTSTMVVGYGIQKKTPVEPVRFFADRPFLYLIREKSSGVILFIGRMDDPRE